MSPSLMALAVPPVERSSTPLSWRNWANSTRPVLSVTERSARLIEVSTIILFSSILCLDDCCVC